MSLFGSIQRGLTKALVQSQDFLLPKPLPEELLNPVDVFKRYQDAISSLSAGNDPELSRTVLDISREMFKAEEQRWQNTLARTAPTLTVAGFGLALFGGLAALLGQHTEAVRRSVLLEISFAVLVATGVFYLFGSIRYALKVHGASVRHTVDPSEVAPAASTSHVTYAIALSQKLLGHTTENYKVDNLLGQRTFASQRCVWMGLVALTLAAALLVGSVLTGSQEPAQSIGSPTAASQLSGCSTQGAVQMIARPTSGQNGPSARQGQSISNPPQAARPRNSPQAQHN